MLKYSEKNESNINQAIVDNASLLTIQNSTQREISLQSLVTGKEIAKIQPGETFALQKDETISYETLTVARIQCCKTKANLDCEYILIKNLGVNDIGVFDPQQDGVDNPISVFPGVSLPKLDIIQKNCREIAAPIEALVLGGRVLL